MKGVPMSWAGRRGGGGTGGTGKPKPPGGKAAGNQAPGKALRGRGEGRGGGRKPKGAGRSLKHWGTILLRLQTRWAHSGGEGHAAPFRWEGRGGGGRAKRTPGDTLALTGEGGTQWRRGSLSHSPWGRGGGTFRGKRDVREVVRGSVCR